METSAPTSTLSSRIRGALYGVATCDALGGPVEFKLRGDFEPVTKYRYNANFDLAPGAWTDDTSMTLCLAQSLVEHRGQFDLQDQIRKYVRWHEEGYMSSTGSCFDIGNATREALGIWRTAIDNKLSGDQAWKKSKAKIHQKLNHDSCCGNGSLMRCVPIPLVFYYDPGIARACASTQSTSTHPHVTCLEACQIYTEIIGNVLRSAAPDKGSVFTTLKGLQYTSPALASMLIKYRTIEDFVNTPDSGISSSGYVVHTLEAALWAFFTTETFDKGALKVVNLGDDADTVGAVYGGLAGAYYGFEGIPEDWVDGLYAKGMVDEVVEAVVKLAEEKEAEKRKLKEAGEGV